MTAQRNDLSSSGDRIADRITVLFCWAVALVLFIQFFDTAKIVLLGIIAASATASALRPLVRITPGPRSVRAVLVGIAPAIVFVGMISVAAWLLAEPVYAQFKQWPAMQEKINQVLMGWSTRLGLSEPVQLKGLLTQLGGWITGSSGAKLFSTTTGIVSGVLIAIAFVFFGSIYMLMEPPTLFMERVLQLFPPKRRPQLRAVLTDLPYRLRWWMIGTGIGAAVIGLASWLGYWLIGLEFALPLALVAAVGEIIPTIGPIVTFLIALLFATTGGTGQIIGVAVVYVVIQGIESHVLMPVVMKKAVAIPPIVTLFSLVLWGTVFGMAGLLLAIPINLVLWTFAEQFIARPDEKKIKQAEAKAEEE